MKLTAVGFRADMSQVQVPLAREESFVIGDIM
ncbi:protein of unknown function [Burkholderia multivorans]